MVDYCLYCGESKYNSCKYTVSKQETDGFKSSLSDLVITNNDQCLTKGDKCFDLVLNPGPLGYETTALLLSHLPSLSLSLSLQNG